MSMRKRTTVAEIVNERIMKELEKGIIPWHKPWSGARNGAYSHSTGRPYSLINQMLLGKPGEYITSKQLSEAGGKVKKGEEPGIVVFWKQTPAGGEEAEEENARTYPVLRYYRVYHIDQCEGVEAKHTPEEAPSFAASEEAERMIASYLARSGCTLEHRIQDMASYSPSLDLISMPMADQFDSEDYYYATLFHEAAHSTGHVSRLNRDLKGGFGSELYSREELIAEFTTASVMNILGLETEKTIRNNAAYIQSWLKALKKDARMLIWAASRADKALRIIADDVAIQPAAARDIQVETATKPPVNRARKTAVAATATTAAVQKAAERFAKACAKGSSQPALAGAFLHEGRQYITDGFVLAAYDTPFEGLPQADVETGNMGVRLERFFQTARVGNMQPLPALDAMRKQYKEAKGKQRAYKQLTKLGDMYINTLFLIQAMELAGVKGGMANVTKPTAPLYIKGAHGETVVLPVNVKGAIATDLWEPELSA